ncbi:hypothetical protein [Kitasatospora cathayae]|uniref:Uncharacterized protein n=1 Tax=Kitasatospora cathayae TaxID=3004092 RepID=A0ABY7Q2Z6_9ACTN|nr:hypothetical protein [Kitasatospora sp. HUAS 3-15]WBP87011.1 hypothetical protein O1G21_14955 [Kitasatospora sp. HUAS 3-15]
MDPIDLTPAAFTTLHGERITARNAPMGEVVLHLGEQVIALNPEEAEKLGRTIVRLSRASQEGGDQ